MNHRTFDASVNEEIRRLSEPVIAGLSVTALCNHIHHAPMEHGDLLELFDKLIGRIAKKDGDDLAALRPIREGYKEYEQYVINEEERARHRAYRVCERGE